MPRSVHVVILAAGEGKRMKCPVPKVLIDLLGRPLVGHVVDAARALGPRRVVVVGGRHLPAMRAALAGEPRLGFVRQAEPRGTAHAVKQALRLLPAGRSDVAILNGDGPLIRGSSLQAALDRHRASGADVTVVSARAGDPAGLGRIVRDSAGRFVRIVEEKDASASECEIREINSGQYFVRVEALRRLLPRIGRDNAQGEYYLTDIVALAGAAVSAYELPDPDEARGINRPRELREVRRILRERILEDLEEAGVVIVDPDLTCVETGVSVGEGTVIHPFVVIRRGVTIAARSAVGPFAHLRAGTVLGEDARIGSFVETKAARIGRGSRAPHLAYLGDARVGEEVNVGAGTITANFDGRAKHETRIEDGALLGAGTILVAPVKVGRGARTGAGAVVTRGRNVPPGTTVVGVPARPHPERRARRTRRNGR